MGEHDEGQDASHDDAAQQPPAGAGGRPSRVRLGIPPTRTASRQARRALDQLDLPPAIAHTAALLLSELVTNSVRHAGLTPDELIQLTVDWSGTRLQVHVRDGGQGQHPRPAGASGSTRPTPGAESGWGLYLVDRLASRWGVDAGGYWFELRHEPS